MTASDSITTSIMFPMSKNRLAVDWEFFSLSLSLSLSLYTYINRYRFDQPQPGWTEAKAEGRRDGQSQESHRTLLFQLLKWRPQQNAMCLTNCRKASFQRLSENIPFRRRRPSTSGNKKNKKSATRERSYQFSQPKHWTMNASPHPPDPMDPRKMSMNCS